MQHSKMFRFIVGVYLLVVFAAVAAADLTLINPDNKNLSYTGRIDFSDKNAPLISWPGTSIKANFTGTALTVMLDDQLGKNYFSVIVDGEIYHPYVIEAKQGLQEYTISTVLPLGEHSVEIYKRTEGEEGHTLFKGLKINGKLLPPPARPTRRIEIFGDSVSSGMGNEAADEGADNLLSEKNHYWAYGSIAARALNAELHTTSQSGIGIMVSWFPFVMPQFFDQLSAVGNNDSQWNFSQWTPDVVVINLLQNDSWLIDRHKRLDPLPSDAERIQAYTDFVRTIRAKYPNAEIICVLGSMDIMANEKWPNYVRAAVKDMQNNGDKKIDTLFFEYTGYGHHPRIAQHKNNAKKLVEFIGHKMRW